MYARLFPFPGRYFRHLVCCYLFFDKAWRLTSQGEDTMSQEHNGHAIDRKRKWVDSLAQKIEDEICIAEAWLADEMNQIAELYRPMTARVERINTGHVQDLNGLMHLIKDFHRERGDFDACYFNKDCREVLCRFYDSLSDFVRDNSDLDGLVQVHADMKPLIPKMREASTGTASESKVRFYLAHAAAQTFRAKQAYNFMSSRTEKGEKNDAIPKTLCMTPLFRSCLHFGTISRYKTTRDRQRTKNEQNDSSMPQDTTEHSREVIRLLITVCVAVLEIPPERLPALKLDYAWLGLVVQGHLID